MGSPATSVRLLKAQHLKRRADGALKAGNHRDARRWYSQALDELPAAADVTERRAILGNLSLLELGVGKFEDALLYAERAITLCAGWSKGHYRRGRALQALSRHVEAMAAFRRAWLLEEDAECGRMMWQCVTKMTRQEVADEILMLLDLVGQPSKTATPTPLLLLPPSLTAAADTAAGVHSGADATRGKLVGRVGATSHTATLQVAAEAATRRSTASGDSAAGQDACAVDLTSDLSVFVESDAGQAVHDAAAEPEAVRAGHDAVARLLAVQAGHGAVAGLSAVRAGHASTQRSTRGQAVVVAGPEVGQQVVAAAGDRAVDWRARGDVQVEELREAAYYMVTASERDNGIPSGGVDDSLRSRYLEWMRRREGVSAHERLTLRSTVLRTAKRYRDAAAEARAAVSTLRKLLQACGKATQVEALMDELAQAYSALGQALMADDKHPEQRCFSAAVTAFACAADLCPGDGARYVSRLRSASSNLDAATLGRALLEARRHMSPPGVTPAVTVGSSSCGDGALKAEQQEARDVTFSADVGGSMLARLSLTEGQYSAICIDGVTAGVGAMATSVAYNDKGEGDAAGGGTGPRQHRRSALGDNVTTTTAVSSGGADGGASASRQQGSRAPAAAHRSSSATTSSLPGTSTTELGSSSATHAALAHTEHSSPPAAAAPPRTPTEHRDVPRDGAPCDDVTTTGGPYWLEVAAEVPGVSARDFGAAARADLRASLARLAQLPLAHVLLDRVAAPRYHGGPLTMHLQVHCGRNMAKAHMMSTLLMSKDSAMSITPCTATAAVNAAEGDLDARGTTATAYEHKVAEEQQQEVGEHRNAFETDGACAGGDDRTASGLRGEDAASPSSSSKSKAADDGVLAGTMKSCGVAPPVRRHGALCGRLQVKEVRLCSAGAASPAIPSGAALKQQKPNQNGNAAAASPNINSSSGAGSSGAGSSGSSGEGDDADVDAIGDREDAQAMTQWEEKQALALKLEKQKERGSVLALPYRHHRLVTSTGAAVERPDKHPFRLSRVYYEARDLPDGQHATWCEMADGSCRWRQSSSEVRIIALQVPPGLPPKLLAVTLDMHTIEVRHRVTGVVYLSGRLERGISPDDSTWTHGGGAGEDGCLITLAKMNLELYARMHQHAATWWPRLFTHHPNLEGADWDDYEKDYSDLPSEVLAQHVAEEAAGEGPRRLADLERRAQKDIQAKDEERRRRRRELLAEFVL